MASLSGSKIKDTYSLLLKLASSSASATEQIVEDGAGTSTALKLSTDTVETTGDLKISGTPAEAASGDVTALMLSSTGVVVTRNLSTSPIGTASIEANSPIVATGSTVGLADPGTLNALTGSGTANNDKFLIWDEGASEYKSITAAELTDYMGTNVAAQQNAFIARLQAVTNIPTEALKLPFAEVYGDGTATGSTSLATSCVTFGAASSEVQLVSLVNPRDTFQINSEALYNVDINLEMSCTVNPDSDVTIALVKDSGPTNEIVSYRTVKSGTYTASFSKAVYMQAGETYYVTVVCTSEGNTVTKNSTVTLTNLGTANSSF